MCFGSGLPLPHHGRLAATAPLWFNEEGPRATMKPGEVIVVSNRETPSENPKPPWWAMILVGLVLLVAVVGYFIKY
jgi:hypothetical protein